MCGISGMFASPDEAVIQRMISILSHRGPDGNGIWVDSNEQVGLGHTRLAIIDFSSAGLLKFEDKFLPSTWLPKCTSCILSEIKSSMPGPPEKVAIAIG